MCVSFAYLVYKFASSEGAPDGIKIELFFFVDVRTFWHDDRRRTIHRFTIYIATVKTIYRLDAGVQFVANVVLVDFREERVVFHYLRAGLYVRVQVLRVSSRLEHFAGVFEYLLATVFGVFVHFFQIDGELFLFAETGRLRFHYVVHFGFEVRPGVDGFVFRFAQERHSSDSRRQSAAYLAVIAGRILGAGPYVWFNSFY